LRIVLNPSTKAEAVQILPKRARFIRLCGGTCIISIIRFLIAMVVVSGRLDIRSSMKFSPSSEAPSKLVRTKKNTRKGKRENNTIKDI
jgi:hypothetical protein